jgi:hypothetical protein
MGQTGVAAMYDGNTVTIDYTGSTDLAGSTPEGKTYSVTLQSQLSGKMVQGTFDIVMKNPCLDPAIVTSSGPNTADQSYLLGSQSSSFTHSTHVINAPANIKNLCGTLKYSVDLGALQGAVVYQSSLKKFTIYSSDVSLMA